MANLSGLSSMATRGVLADLATSFEKRTDNAVTITSVGGIDAARKIRADEPFDIVVMASPVMAQLEAEGFVLAGSRKDFACSNIAAAVRIGTPLPDLADAASVRDVIADASKVGYSSGPSGDHLVKLCREWSITDAKLVKAPPGVPVAKLLADGDVDLGFQQLSELLDMPGIAIAGPLPREIQATTIFVAGICRTCGDVDTARAFLEFVTSVDAVAAKRARGLE